MNQSTKAGWLCLILCALQLRMMLGPEVDRKIEEKLGRLEARGAEANSAERAT